MSVTRRRDLRDQGSCRSGLVRMQLAASHAFPERVPELCIEQLRDVECDVGLVQQPGRRVGVRLRLRAG